MEHAFRIDVRGLFELLPQHLHGRPEVFVRELIQNGVDALRARALIDPDHDGSITIEILRGPRPSLAFLDDGIGLTEDETHCFLATIGQMSKRDPGSRDSTKPLGRFGVGLLSCFAVADEVAIVTRSARPGPQQTIEWRGRCDGTYAVRVLDREIAPGTQVYLTCKPLFENHFTFETVSALTRRFAGMLAERIQVVAGGETALASAGGPPWHRRFASTEQQRRELLAFGRDTFGAPFLDAVPLKSKVGAVDGVAFILPYQTNMAVPRAHRVYLKGMFLAESMDGLLPAWASFVRCVVNSDELRPTASRAAFHEDEALRLAREAIGCCLRDYLIGLAARDPAKLKQLVSVHALAMKELALHDDEFSRLLLDTLPFNTSMGVMPLGEYRREYGRVLYVTDQDRFHQVAPFATARNIALVNASDPLDAALLARLPFGVGETGSEPLDPAALDPMLDVLSCRERSEIEVLISLADQVLRPFRCETEAAKFLPADLPSFFRSAPGDGVSGAPALLTFNYLNPLVAQVAACPDAAVQKRSVEMLYAQALLLGHHPEAGRHVSLLNEGLTSLIEAELRPKIR